MHIALLTPNLTVDGGVASHVRTSADALGAAGHRVTVVASDVRISDGGQGPQLTTSGGLSPEVVEAAVRSVTRERCTVAHVHGIDDPALVVALQAHGVPVVVSAHGYAGCGPGTGYITPGRPCWRPHGAACLGSMALRGCAHHRNPVEMVRAWRMTPARLRGLRAANTVVAYSHAVGKHLAANGIHAEIVPLAIAAQRKALCPLTETRRVLFVGRLSHHKGVLELLRAFVTVPGVLEIVGDGYLMDDARRLARKLGIVERCEFRGWLDAAAIADAYDRAQVVAVPSVWPEPFGLVGIDALARGRPVVGSKTGGIVEWLVHDEVGLLVPPGDIAALSRALCRVIGDVETASRYGTAGAAFVHGRFSSRASVDAILNVYRAAVDVAGRAKRHGGAPAPRS